MKEKILMIVSRETEKSVGEASKVEELGLDSLGFLDLINTIEQECSVILDDAQFGETTTLGDIIRAAETAQVSA